MKIAVVGTGYVGLSLAVLLSQHNEVVALDIIKEKVDMINNKKSPISDKEIEEYLKTKELKLLATTDKQKAYKDAEYIIIATPTDYDPEKNYFDTSSVNSVIKDVLNINPEAVLIIKSTVPVGYTDEARKKYKTNNIIFSPEFLREGQALYDNLYPSRIVIGEQSKRAEKFAELLKQAAIKKEIPTLFTNSTEAEAIKLFANTYLAMRVSFFNELDTFAEIREANRTRKDHIANMVMKRNPKTVGVYRLTMKTNSDNFRESAILYIIMKLKKYSMKILIYEPELKEDTFYNLEVVKDINKFKQRSELIITNRMHKELKDVEYKVHTRDLYGRD